MARISVIEAPYEGEDQVGLDHGSVRLTVKVGQNVVSTADVVAFPGSPAAPATSEQTAAKITDCLGLYASGCGRSLSATSLKIELERRTGCEGPAAPLRPVGTTGQVELERLLPGEVSA
jgi:hypothetical protein